MGVLSVSLHPPPTKPEASGVLPVLKAVVKMMGRRVESHLPVAICDSENIGPHPNPGHVNLSPEVAKGTLQI